MIRIGILNKGSIFNWGHNFGYWYFIKNGTTMNTVYDIKDYKLSAT